MPIHIIIFSMNYTAIIIIKIYSAVSCTKLGKIPNLKLNSAMSTT